LVGYAGDTRSTVTAHPPVEAAPAVVVGADHLEAPGRGQVGREGVAPAGAAKPPLVQLPARTTGASSTGSTREPPAPLRGGGGDAIIAIRSGGWLRHPAWRRGG